MTDTTDATTDGPTDEIPGVPVTVNGTSIVAQPGELLIEACERNGVYIPRFCYHPRMESVGMCRVCLVEVDTGRGPALQPSCMLTVTEGMSVETESEVTKKAQDGVLEFLLINHPLDCPVCDKGGECPLQDQTMAYGPGESRFVEEKRHFEKPIAISETVYLDRERCILCDRCTRFAKDVAGDALIHFMDRGNHSEVNVFPDEPFASYFSGNTVQICPVGALTAKPYRFKARPWDLDESTSTAWVDSVGSRITVQSSRNQVLRVLGVDADAVNWGWLSDKERFAFEATNSEDRIRQPLVREGDDLAPTGWANALTRATDALSGTDAGRIGFIGGARLTNEAQYAWTKLAKSVIGTDNVDAQLADGLPPELILSLPRATIDRACTPGGTVILLGPDPKEELGSLYLRLRHAVVNDGVTLIEMTPGGTGLSHLGAHRLHPRPGEAASVATALVDAIGGQNAVAAAGVSAAAINKAAAAVGEGPITVLIGRPSLAESADAVVAASSILGSLNDVAFLSLLRRGNVHGAIDMGMAPGLLPGRASLAAGRSRFDGHWTSVPSTPGLDTTGMLEAAAAGKIDVLVLLGADPLNDFPDRTLAEKALTSVGTVITVDTLPNDSLRLAADVVLAAAGPTESDGTFTNLEGRVSVMAQKVTPVGTARADWMIAVELASRLGGDMGVVSPASIRRELRAVAPLYADLTEVALDLNRVEGVLLAGVGEVEIAAVTSAPVPVNDAYSLRLVVQRSMYDDGVLVRHSPSSRALAPEFSVKISPHDFDKLGVDSGDTVSIQSGRASIVGRLFADAGVPAGSALVPWLAPGNPANQLITAGEMVTNVRVERI